MKNIIFVIVILIVTISSCKKNDGIVVNNGILSEEANQVSVVEDILELVSGNI